MRVTSLNKTSPLEWCWTTTFIAIPLPDFIKTTALVTASFTLLLTLCSVLANSLYIIIYTKCPRLQSVSNLLLLNVSVNGVLLACISQPLFVIRCFMEVYATRNCILWEIQHLSFLYLACVYFLTIFLISCDRFVATFAPLRYAIIFTKFKVSLCVVVLWCFSLVLASSIVFGYFIFYAVVCPLFTITTILVLCIYLRILQQARIQRGIIQNQFPSGRFVGDANLTSSSNNNNNNNNNSSINSNNNNSNKNSNNNNSKNSNRKTTCRLNNNVYYSIKCAGICK